MGGGPAPGLERSIEPVVAGIVGRVPLLTPTLPPATHTNAWILGEERLTVVDPASPWDGPRADLAQALEGRRVERIVLTHHHPDHVGAAAWLRARTGAPILAHPLTAALVDFEIDGELGHDDLVETDSAAWRVDFTPGHAPGHVCLHDPATDTVIAGDMVAAVGTIVLAPPEGDLALYLDSLERLRTLGAARLCPAHGGVITDARGKLTEYIEHRHMRTGQVRGELARLAASEAGGVLPLALVPGIYPELPVAFHGIAACQVFCHLLWLEARDEVHRVVGPPDTSGVVPMPRFRPEGP